MKNLELEIQILKDKIIRLQIENSRFKLELQSYKEEWSHPKSCLNNEDPWEKWKDKLY
jgi:hypothetical protein